MTSLKRYNRNLTEIGIIKVKRLCKVYYIIIDSRKLSKIIARLINILS